MRKPILFSTCTGALVRIDSRGKLYDSGGIPLVGTGGIPVFHLRSKRQRKRLYRILSTAVPGAKLKELAPGYRQP